MGRRTRAREMNELDEREFLMLLQESFQGIRWRVWRNCSSPTAGTSASPWRSSPSWTSRSSCRSLPRSTTSPTFPTLGGGVGVLDRAVGARRRGSLRRRFSGASPSLAACRTCAAAPPPAAATGNLDENCNKFADRLRTRAAVPAPVERAGVRVGYGAGNFSGRSLAASQQWVETGDAVSNQYAATREDARDHMRLRNVLSAGDAGVSVRE